MNKASKLILLACAAVLMAAGCEQPPGPFVPKSHTPGAITYCNDYTGHKPGAKPFIMGGTCCCTPSDELMAQLQKDGFCIGMSAEGLAQEYKARKIALREPGHMFCNGLCEAGPHVALGGHCMCPPTPGTVYYEQVVTAAVK
jgi:hypothetical protein